MLTTKFSYDVCMSYPYITCVLQGVHVLRMCMLCVRACVCVYVCMCACVACVCVCVCVLHFIYRETSL